MRSLVAPNVYSCDEQATESFHGCRETLTKDAHREDSKEQNEIIIHSYGSICFIPPPPPFRFHLVRRVFDAHVNRGRAAAAAVGSRGLSRTAIRTAPHTQTTRTRTGKVRKRGEKRQVESVARGRREIYAAGVALRCARVPLRRGSRGRRSRSYHARTATLARSRRWDSHTDMGICMHVLLFRVTSFCPLAPCCFA